MLFQKKREKKNGADLMHLGESKKECLVTMLSARKPARADGCIAHVMTNLPDTGANK